MCTLLLAYQQHPRYRLILAANRDEFYARPTARAAWWDDAPEVFGGRDLVHGGTWLGVTRSGRIAALTNYREPHKARRDGPSRGRLVSGFLQGEASAEEYLEGLRRRAASYSGYNLLVGDATALYCYSNRNDRIVRITPGIFGLSNHLLDTPWPKVVRGKEALSRIVEMEEFAVEEVFSILGDRGRAADEELPDTGVGLERERLLSSIFISSGNYGTRSSSVLLVGEDRMASFTERSFDAGATRDTRECFDWSK